MVAKLKEMGTEFKYIEVPGGLHSDVVAPNVAAIVEFFDAHRKVSSRRRSPDVRLYNFWILRAVYLRSRPATRRVNSGSARRFSRCGSTRKKGQQAKPVSTLRSSHAIAFSVSPITAYTQAIW